MSRKSSKPAPRKKAVVKQPPQEKASPQKMLDLIFNLATMAPVAKQQHMLAQQCYDELSSGFKAK